MRVPYSSDAFTRKGKLFFISTLEKQRDLNALFSEIDFVFKNPQTREVVLYFNERFRPFPNIIVPLACAINHINKIGKRIRVNKSFVELDETRFAKPEVFSHKSDGIQTLPGNVWLYENSEELNCLVSSTINYLQYKLEWSSGTLHALEWSLYELLDNVFQHSLSNCGFFMFQIQQHKKRLSYCVADQGRGIYNSLSDSIHKPNSPLDAITLAVRKGVTRDNKTNMGNGLWGATEIISRNKGQLTISSGGAALFFNRNSAESQPVPKVQVLDKNAPGTIIDAQIYSSVEVQMSEMFDNNCPVNLRLEELENEDGAIKVELKNLKIGAGTRESGMLTKIFIRNLLNESNRLIIIDFTDIGIISSSFADELIAKIYVDMGSESFNSRLRLHNLNETNRLIIQNVISQRNY